MYKGRRKGKRLGTRNVRHVSPDVHAIDYLKKCFILHETDTEDKRN